MTSTLKCFPGYVHEIPCIDEVIGTFKWSKKAAEKMEKLDSDCNLTAGLEAVLKFSVGARVMLVEKY